MVSTESMKNENKANLTELGLTCKQNNVCSNTDSMN